MTTNGEKRKRVMQRSMRLGHCVCDAAKPCPCDLFKQKNICLCAGERLEVPAGPVALTQLVEKAGCASKIDQAFLKAALKNLPNLDDPRVLVGMPAGDDAGVYDIGKWHGIGPDRRRIHAVGGRSVPVRAGGCGQFAQRRVCHGRTADHGSIDRRIPGTQSSRQRPA